MNENTQRERIYKFKKDFKDDARKLSPNFSKS